jgi:serine/threonine-protein kinase
VLDFGLAKMLDGPAEAGPHGSMSPTITTPAMTQIGVILGTAAYMAPEQARGKPVDKRSDIWAFGCVLFEMLTGKRAFDGEDATDTIALVVRGEPKWDALPADLPESIRLLVRRCLEKDRKKRIGDISTALFIMSEPSLVTAARGPLSDDTTARSSQWRQIGWYALAMVAGGVLLFVGARMLGRQAPPRVSRLELVTSGPSTLLRNVNTQRLAISRDGSRIFYFGGVPGDPGGLFERRIDQLDSTLLSERGSSPFVRPDGNWVGFFAQTMLRKVSVAGGPSLDIIRPDGPIRGATWGEDDTIIFATSNQSTGLIRVASAGGTSTVLTRPDKNKGEADHFWPRFLPGGHAVLFTVVTGSFDLAEAQVAVLDLRSPGATPKILFRGGSDARYVPTGHLVYLAAGSVRAVPFDLDRLEVKDGSPVPVLPSLNSTGTTGDFDVADEGTLVYVPAGDAIAVERTLAWVDRQGKEEAIPAPARAYVYPRISPDGKRLAIDVREQENDIWVWDLVRHGFTRVTKDPGLDRMPVWADGEHIIFSSTRNGSANVYRQRADGTGTAEQFTRAPTNQLPVSLSPAGDRVVLQEGVGGAATTDLMTLHLDPRATRTNPPLGTTEPLVKTPDGEANGMISPDGRWLAYQSNESGNWDIYVRPFPVAEGGARFTVSTGGGTQPRWAPDGRELFYLSPRNEMISVRVANGTTWSAGTPVTLFDASAYFTGGTGNPFFNYDVAKDGRFLMIKPVAGASPGGASANLIVVQNWHEELKRLVAAK